MDAWLKNARAAGIVLEIAEVIVANKAWLSEIDGKIGDGDHGVNMSKGFSRAAERIVPDMTLDDALAILSDVLLTEIGGSMGPLYGLMFEDMANSIAGKDVIGAPEFGAMLRAGLDSVQAVGAASAGDKTLIDTLDPAARAFDANSEAGFDVALTAMAAAAAAGRDSTVDMVARLGRAARLGERSSGVLDAGATSCCLILQTLAVGTMARLEG